VNDWGNFHVLIGTAGATLMGLTFVAVSLSPKVIADRTDTVVRAFTTPIVAFFATVLILALLMLVPKLPMHVEGILFAIVGAGGFIYILNTGAHRQWRELELGIDDWIWYIALPLLSYGAIVASAAGVWSASPWAAYALAAAVLALLIVGIRNAWDVFLAIARESQRESK
jgi:hypothetical protein